MKRPGRSLPHLPLTATAAHLQRPHHKPTTCTPSRNTTSLSA
ncbi:hypothetical protein [Streptomyces chrestomyceticus]